MKTLTDVIKSLVEGLEETSKERLQKYSVAAKKDVRIRGLNLKPGDEKEKKKVINRYKGIQTAQDKLKKGSYNESTDIVESSGPYLVGIFRKGSDKFLLWQVSTKSYDCYLTTTQSAKTGWEFKKVVSFKDGVDDAVEKLKKDGYKDITMINESIKAGDVVDWVNPSAKELKTKVKVMKVMGNDAKVEFNGKTYTVSLKNLMLSEETIEEGVSRSEIEKFLTSKGFEHDILRDVWDKDNTRVYYEFNEVTVVRFNNPKSKTIVWKNSIDGNMSIKSIATLISTMITLK
jgi:hypothetical protein